MDSKKQYWKGLAQLENDPAIEKLAHNEFSEHLPVDKFLGDKTLPDTSTSRRDFLKFLGFTTAAAGPPPRRQPFVNGSIFFSSVITLPKQSLIIFSS